MFPRPENGQVVISVDAAGVNLPTRMTFITATFSPVELPFVPGREGARRLRHRRPLSTSFQQIRCPEPAEGRAAGPVRKHTRRARDARTDLSLCATKEPVDAS